MKVVGYASLTHPTASTASKLPSRLPRTRDVTNLRHLRLADRGRRAREARRGRWLCYAVALDKHLARGHVRMIRRFRHGQDRCEADVGAFHDLAPILARLALEDFRQLFLQRRPCLAVHLRVEIGVGEIGMLAQQRVELRFDRADRNEVAAGAFIDAVEMRAAVEKILVAALGPAPARAHVEEHRHQRCRAIAHCSVHHLALAGLRGFQHGGKYADHEIERATAEIADEVERRHRLLPGADRGERACYRDVVDVMAGGVRQRAFLAPASHAAIDQLWIAREHDIRAEAKTFHHAGAETFDQRVRTGEQVEHLCDGRFVLQIEFDYFAAAHRHRLEVLAGADAVERHDLGPHVGKQHAGEWARADAGEFDDAKAGKRAGGAGGGLGGWFVEHLFSLPKETFLETS